MYLAPLPPTLEVTLDLAKSAGVSHVDAEVKQVGAVASLILGDVEPALPVLGDHRFAESLGAVGICPLTDHQHRRVQRRDGRLADRRSLGAIQVGHGGGYRSDVSRDGTAARPKGHGVS